MTETRLTITASPTTVQLTVMPPTLEGLEPTEIGLASADGRWMMKLPRDQFPTFPIIPLEPVVVSITLFRAAVEPVPEKLTDLAPPKLILPQRGH